MFIVIDEGVLGEEEEEELEEEGEGLQPGPDVAPSFVYPTNIRRQES